MNTTKPKIKHAALRKTTETSLFDESISNCVNEVLSNDRNQRHGPCPSPTSSRVRLRTWMDADLEPFRKINANAQVMRYFPQTLSSAENDITSSQTALNQSVDTEMYSFGLRAMYEVTAGNFSFVPSIGLRVSQLSTDEMKVGSVKVDDQDQTLVQVPIALRINAADFNAGGWVVAPSMKIAYVPTFGDKDIEVLHHTQDVIDTAPVQADIGLRVGKDNMLFNVNMLLGSGEYGTSAIGGKVGFKYVF